MTGSGPIIGVLSHMLLVAATCASVKVTGLSSYFCVSAFALGRAGARGDAVAPRRAVWASGRKKADRREAVRSGF